MKQEKILSNRKGGGGSFAPLPEGFKEKRENQHQSVQLDSQKVKYWSTREEILAGMRCAGGGVPSYPQTGGKTGEEDQ